MQKVPAEIDYFTLMSDGSSITFFDVQSYNVALKSWHTNHKMMLQNANNPQEINKDNAQKST